jgi:hypothetical protein
MFSYVKSQLLLIFKIVTKPTFQNNNFNICSAWVCEVVPYFHETTWITGCLKTKCTEVIVTYEDKYMDSLRHCTKIYRLRLQVT